MKHLRALNRDNRGSVVLIFALATPVLLGLSAAALEYGSLVKRRTELQRAADSGAIAGVNQFKIASADDASAIRTAIAMSQGQAQAQAPADRNTVVEATVGGNHSSVQVTVRETVPLSFGKLLNMAQVELAVQSTAKLSGTTRLCLLALDPALQGAFRLEASARMNRPGFPGGHLVWIRQPRAGPQPEHNSVLRLQREGYSRWVRAAGAY